MLEKSMRSMTTDSLFLEPLSLAQRRAARIWRKIDNQTVIKSQPLRRKRRKGGKHDEKQEEDDEKIVIDPSVEIDIEKEVMRLMGGDVLDSDDSSTLTKCVAVTDAQVDGLFAKQRKVYDWGIHPISKNLFVTGKAGTGKTWVLRLLVRLHYLEYMFLILDMSWCAGPAIAVSLSRTNSSVQSDGYCRTSNPRNSNYSFMFSSVCIV
jgi:hypothetical protein